MSRPNVLAVSLAITTFIVGLEAAPTFSHHSHGHNAAFTKLLHEHQHRHQALRSEPKGASSQQEAAVAKPTEDAGLLLPTEDLPLLHIGPVIEAPAESQYVDDTGVGV